MENPTDTAPAQDPPVECEGGEGVARAPKKQLTNGQRQAILHGPKKVGDNAFVVHTSPPIQFKVAPNGLYYYIPTENFRAEIRELRRQAGEPDPRKKDGVCFAGVQRGASFAGVKTEKMGLTTVKENESFYSQRQLEKAQRAKTYHFTD